MAPNRGRASPPPNAMPVYVDFRQMFGSRELLSVPIGYDLGHMRALGWRFPRTVGRELEGGGVVRDDAGCT